MDRFGLVKAALTASVCLGILAGVLVASNEGAEEKGTLTLAQIEKAWRDRAAQFHSGRIAWKETRHLGRGGVLEEGLGSPFHPDTKRAVPDQPMKHTYAREFAFDRGKVRHVSGEPIWDHRLGDFFEGAEVTAFDGEMSTSVRRRPKGEKFPAHGLITHDASQVLSDLLLMPVLWHFCPESRAIDVLKRYSITEQRATIHGAECIALLETSPRPGGVRETMWLEPKRGFIVRRWVDRLAGAVLDQMDVSYRDDPQEGPLPTGWTWLRQTQEGAMRRFVEAEVTRTELNQAIDPGEFRVEFPPGTLVTEMTTDDPKVRQKYYFMLPDGTTRPVSGAELIRQVTPEILAATKPGEAGLLEPRGSRTQWIAAIAAFALTIALVAIWKGRKGRRIART